MHITYHHHVPCGCQVQQALPTPSVTTVFEPVASQLEPVNKRVPQKQAALKQQAHTTSKPSLRNPHVSCKLFASKMNGLLLQCVPPWVTQSVQVRSMCMHAGPCQTIGSTSAHVCACRGPCGSMCVQFCAGSCRSMRVYVGPGGYMRVHTVHACPWGPCESMQIHAGICGSTGVHAGPCGSMRVHACPQDSMRVHAELMNPGICGCMRVHAGLGSSCGSMLVHETPGPCGSWVHVGPCMCMRAYGSPCASTWSMRIHARPC